MRLDHLLSKEIPEPDEVRINVPFIAILVVSFERLILFQRKSSHPFGGDGEGEPRVPIPNTTVKPFSADGTWTAGSWESRTSPSRCYDYTLYSNHEVSWTLCCLDLDFFCLRNNINQLHLENWIAKVKNETSFS